MVAVCDFMSRAPEGSTDRGSSLKRPRDVAGLGLNTHLTDQHVIIIKS